MKTPWLILCGLVVVVAGLWAPVVMAQVDEEEPSVMADEEDVDVSGIEQILRGDQEALTGEFTSYDPAGRRDPFRSLLIGFEEPDEGTIKARPPGLPGMMVEEVRLEGIIQTPGGILAFIQGRDNLSYIIRPGTKLYDGEVQEILPDRVIFKRQVHDPKQLRPYEEVVRELGN
jgi:Tfp pilus assembly protein PilP